MDYRVIEAGEGEVVGIGSDGRPVDKGHFYKSLITGKDLSLLWVQLEPGASGPERDFVMHPDHEEIEFIVYGNGRAVYPDGRSFRLRPGVAVYHGRGTPHRFENDSNEPLIFVVAFSTGDASSVDRVPVVAERE